jgi:hypothetical protein
VCIRGKKKSSWLLFSPQSTCSFHFRSVHFTPFKPSMYRIITCITKHLQQQRNSESNAIILQNIPQSQGAMRSKFVVSLCFSERQRAESQRYICYRTIYSFSKRKGSQIFQKYLASKNHQDQYEPYARIIMRKQLRCNSLGEGKNKQ